MTHTPVHLLSRWARVARRLRAAKRLALFLDFDGTLHPLRRRPEAVVLDRSTRRLLARLSARRRVTLCVISGRRRDDLRKRVGVPGLVYLGLHGWEGGSGMRASARLRAAVKRVRQRLERRLRNLPGIWVEDKTLSVVVHYRAAREAVGRRARSIVRDAVRPDRSELRVLAGKKVWELLPREVPGRERRPRRSSPGDSIRPCRFTSGTIPRTRERSRLCGAASPFESAAVAAPRHALRCATRKKSEAF